MEINKELLRRYSIGLCSPEEKEAVDTWLRSEEDAPFNLTVKQDAEFDLEEEKIWFKVSQEVPMLKRGSVSKKSKIIPLYQRITSYTVAACLALLIFAGGILISDQFDSSDTRASEVVNNLEAQKFAKDLLYVTSNNSKPKKVSLENCEINFEGVIRLYSTSSSANEIICNGQQIKIEPGKAYFLLNSRGKKISVLPNNPLVQDGRHIKAQRSSFKACV
ncbi:MAG: hypothetical protein AAGI25_14560 [Bacteroidota bacterium]